MEDIEYVGDNYNVDADKIRIYGGCLFDNSINWPMLERLLNDEFELRSDDIVISSYPRTGTHWCGVMVDMIKKDGDIQAVKDVFVHDRFTFLCMDKNVMSGAVKDPTTFVPSEDHVAYIKALPSPRLLATHLGHQFLKGAIKRSKCKVIVPVRNPKSVLVSNVHFWNEFVELLQQPTTMKMMLNSQLREQGDKSFFGNYHSFILDWWTNKDELEDQLLFVHYEDMVKDMPSVLRQVATFLGKELSDATIDAMAEELTFNKMKHNPSTGDALSKMSVEIDTPDKPAEPDKPSPVHMRKGKIDDWKNHMTVADSEKVDAFFNKNFKDSDLTFQYQ